MIIANKGRGRPTISASEKEQMVSKIMPFLQSGLSIRKSVREAKISRATFYRMMETDDSFRDKITQSRNYLSILLTNTLVKELFEIAEKQTGNPSKHIPPQPLSREDIKFLFWFALKTRFGKDEWGRLKRADYYDSEREIQRLKQTL